jgi:alpha-beta hydrolase superfamily lysophospholipase
VSAPPIWFGPERGELLAMYHAPAAVSGKLGIVLCNPFGYEAMCTHRAYRHLAEQLAARGFPVLCFDYAGTGNASGHDRDPQRWSTWQHSIGAALDELGRLSGCTRFGLVGLRLGANLALLAAQARTDIAALVLWAPLFTGKSFLREELAVHKLRALQTVHDAASVANAETEVLGFVLSAESRASLEAHSLMELKSAPARAALVLTRETPLQEPRVAARLTELGVEVTCEVAEGYALMLSGGEPPDAAWARIVDYFVAQSVAQTAEASAAPANPANVLPLVATRAVWDSSLAGDSIDETASFFGPDARLFGVISHGRVAASAEPPPAVLLLSGGFNHHVGQNRMYTRWARAWAALGVTCLRFDLAGLGDSRTADGMPEGQLHSLESIADVQAAMDHLAAISGIRRFAIVGLCSGAFIGFHTALADSRVVSLALLNWTRFYPTGTTAPPLRSQYRSLHFYWSALTQRRTWRKLLSGRVHVRGISKNFVTRMLRRLRAWLVPALPAGRVDTDPATRLARDMHRLAARGVKSLIVYNGEDAAIDEVHEQLGLEERRLRALRALRFEILDGTDHIFTPSWSQERLAALVTEHLLPVESSRPPAPFTEVALTDGTRANHG